MRLNETVIMARGWEFAASSPEFTGLASSMERSKAIVLERKTDMPDELKEQMEVASHALLKTLESGLWGGGPFTVSLSGSENVLYMAVTRR
jgi:hypothetical protein